MPKVPQASDIQVGSFGLGSIAKIDPGVANYTGQAGRAIGNAIESFGSAFAEVASRVNEAQSKQNLVDLQLDYTIKADQQFQDMQKTQTWDSQPQRWQSLFDEQDNSDKFKGLNAKDQASYKLWRFKNARQYAHTATTMFQQQKAGEFEDVFNGYLNKSNEMFDAQKNPYLTYMPAPLLGQKIDEQKDILINKAKSMGDVIKPKDIQKKIDKINGWSGDTKLRLLQQMYPDKYEQIINNKLNGGRPKPQADNQQLPKIGELTFAEPPLQRSSNIGRERSTSSIKGLVVHMTEGSDNMEGNGSWSNQTNTGANYYVGKDGKIFQWAPDNVAMNHVGKGRNGKRDDLKNRNTLSIEIMTRERERPNKIQIAAATELAKSLADKYGFDPQNDVYGHGELTKSSHRHPNEAIEVVQALRSQKTQVASADGKMRLFSPEDAQAVAQQEAGKFIPQLVEKYGEDIKYLAKEKPNVKIAQVIDPNDIEDLSSQFDGADIGSFTVGDLNNFINEYGQQDAQTPEEGDTSQQDQQEEDLSAPFDTNQSFGPDALSLKPEELKHLSKDTLRLMKEDFKAQRKAATDISKGTAKQMLDNKAQSILKTGADPDPKNFDPDIVDKMFPAGSKDRNAYEATFKDNKNLYDVFGNYGDLPLDEIEAKYNNREKLLTTDQSKTYAYRMYDKISKMYKDDPAKYVDESALVKQVRNTFQNGIPKTPDEKKKLIEARLAAQKNVGIPPEGQSPITDAEASVYASSLSNLLEDEVADRVRSIQKSIEQNYGKENAPKVLRAVVREYIKNPSYLSDSMGLINNELYPEQIKASETLSPAATKKINEAAESNGIMDSMKKLFFGEQQPTPTAPVNKPTDEDVRGLQAGTMGIKEFKDKYKLTQPEVNRYLIPSLRGRF